MTTPTAHWHRGSGWPCPWPGCRAELHSVVMLGIHYEEHERRNAEQLSLDFGVELFQNQTVEQRQLFVKSP